MPAKPLKPDSGTFQLAEPSKEILAFQDIGRRMFLTQDPSEIVRLLSETALGYTHAAAISVFLFDASGTDLSGGDPSLLPEAAVLDYVFQEDRPPTIPHGKGRFITVLPLRVAQQRVGVLVLDVTGMGENVARMNLEPVSILANQAAAALTNAQLVTRTIGESALLSNILDSITNAIITLDIESRITRLNRNAMAMLGVSADDVGQLYTDVLPPEVLQAMSDLLNETHHGYSLEKMVTVRLPHGLELHIAVSTALLRDDAFNPTGTILVFRDMTASRELDRLRKLDTMKSEFVANVSHELKTPLTSIKAYTEALIDMAKDDQMKAFLQVIDEESDRLLFLINDLLNVSRIQSGKMKMHFELAAPRTVIDEVMSISKVQSEQHRINLEIAPDLPEMLLDKEKMKEVMINLVSNAIKYSPAGGTVSVRMFREENNLRIEVQDEGIGIPKEHQGKIFQAFYRVDSSHTAEIPGTGLGLVIVKAIVEHHGGHAWFESEAGRGTTFFLLIPVRQEIRLGEAGFDLGTMA